MNLTKLNLKMIAILFLMFQHPLQSGKSKSPWTRESYRRTS